MSTPEVIPPAESEMIQQIVQLTVAQLRMRYPGDQQILRGVHAKDHGCVKATFTVNPCLAEQLPDGTTLRHGVFATPGRSYSALVRFSNASTSVAPDSPLNEKGVQVHGSRGMAVKLLNVDGPQLGLLAGDERLRDLQQRTGQTPGPHGGGTQDFLLINQPVFAFANVEDYAALSQVLLDNKDKPNAFFGRASLPPGTPPTAAPTPIQQRALETLEIVQKIQKTAAPFDFQEPPASPVDNDYFGAAPFRFGPNQVMRFQLRVENRSKESPNMSDPNYLRTALIQRLRSNDKGPVVFQFEAQIRKDSSISNPADEIENASHDWPETTPFVSLATLSIPIQEFDSEQQRQACERLVFSPWHGLVDHQPLGGINRLRRAVYEASAMFRNLPKEPV